jgi:hypothetical protein
MQDANPVIISDEETFLPERCIFSVSLIIISIRTVTVLVRLLLLKPLTFTQGLDIDE